MGYCVVLLLVLCGLLPHMGFSIELTAVVQTMSGPVRGEVVRVDGKTVHRYRGIPYATPPLGQLRFAPPVPPDPWTIPRYVTEYGDRCMSRKLLDAFLYYPPKVPSAMSEDCLYLNVVVPEGGEQNKAVMVYIHGGTLYFNSAEYIDLEALAIAGDVIHIAMNYRLDIFGFLATMSDSAPGNVGLLDQVLAMKWVKENVARFGGDPERVTIFGMSAGGWSVSAHLVSPLSRGLFTRAIIQSGSLYGLRLETREERARSLRTGIIMINCTGWRSEDIILDCLRHQPASDLMLAFIGAPMVLPTTGDEFLPENFTQMYDSHQVHPNVQVLIGIVSEEGANLHLNVLRDDIYNGQLLTNGMDCVDAVNYRRLNLIDSPKRKYLSDREKTLIRDRIRDRIRDAYITNCSDQINVLRGAMNILGDSLFTMPTIGTVKRITEAGNAAHLYYFNQVPAVRLPTNIPQLSSVAPPALGFGTFHGLDMFYMFGYALVKDVPYSVVDIMPENEKLLSQSMVHSWTTFAKSGEAEFIAENGQVLAWPEYDEVKEFYIEWKSPMTNASIKQHLKPAAFSFWRKLVPNMIIDPERYFSNNSNDAASLQTINMSICQIYLVWYCVNN